MGVCNVTIPYDTVTTEGKKNTDNTGDNVGESPSYKGGGSKMYQYQKLRDSAPEPHRL